MTVKITLPFEVFFDINGQPLENGKIYIGEEGLDPETNPVSVYYDSNLTVVASQPLRTINGYLSRDGAPSETYTSNTHSITVRDKNDVLVYTNLSAGGELESEDNIIDVYNDYIQNSLDFSGVINLVTANPTKKYILSFSDGVVPLDISNTIPSNVTKLVFKLGGSIRFDSYDLTFSNQLIESDNYNKIFDYNSSGVASGTFANSEIYPEWWGAVGDLVTDDYVSISNVIAFADGYTSSGVTIKLNRSYLVESTLTLGDNVTIFGGGYSLTQIKTTSLDNLILINGNDVNISGIWLNNVKGANVANAVKIKASSNRSKVENCKITAHTSGVDMSESNINTVRVIKNLFDTCGYGVLTNSATDMQRLWIIGNEFVNIRTDCVELNLSGDQVYIQDNFFNNTDGSASTGGFGVGIAKAKNVLVKNNIFYKSRNQGLHIEDDASYIVVEGNLFDQIASTPAPDDDNNSAIHILGGNYITVINNIITSPNDRGIYLVNGGTNKKYITITGNQIYNAGSDGIQIGVNGEGIICTDNIITNCADDGIDLINAPRDTTVKNNKLFNNGGYGINIRTRIRDLGSNYFEGNALGTISTNQSDAYINVGGFICKASGVNIPAVGTGYFDFLDLKGPNIALSASSLNANSSVFLKIPNSSDGNITIDGTTYDDGTSYTDASGGIHLFVVSASITNNLSNSAGLYQLNLEYIKGSFNTWVNGNSWYVNNFSEYRAIGADNLSEKEVKIDELEFAWNPPDIPNNETQSTTFSFPGAATKDFISVAREGNDLGTQITAYCSTANVITVVISNNTGGVVSLGNAPIRIRKTSYYTGRKIKEIFGSLDTGDPVLHEGFLSIKIYNSYTSPVSTQVITTFKGDLLLRSVT